MLKSYLRRLVPRAAALGTLSRIAGGGPGPQGLGGSGCATESSVRGTALEKHLGRVAEQYLADGLVMGIARLNLLREGVEVAEAALERAPREDRIDPGGLVGPVGDRDGAGDGVRAGEAGLGAVGHVDRCRRTRPPVDLGDGVEEVA